MRGREHKPRDAIAEQCQTDAHLAEMVSGDKNHPTPGIDAGVGSR